MDAAEIEKHVERHNRGELFAALGLAGWSMLLWGISYAFVALLTFVATTVLFHRVPNPTITHGVSLVVMVLLLLESVRYRRELFRASDLEHAYYVTGTAEPLWSRGDERHAAYGISQFMLSAPRTLIDAYRHLQQRRHPQTKIVEAASKACEGLRQCSGWIDARKLGVSHETLQFLHDVRLIWMRRDGNELQVKRSPF